MIPQGQYNALQRVALVVDKLGTVLVFLVASLSFTFILIVFEKYSEAILYATALVLFALIVGGLKLTTRIPRPQDRLVEAEFSSFPSGHATGATLFASMTTYITGSYLGFENVIPLGLALGLWAILVAWSRIELRAHRPIEVFAGISIALIITSIVILGKGTIIDTALPLINLL